MANFVKKFFSVLLAVCLCVGMAHQVFAGTGQTMVHIHKVGEMGSNKDEVTISFKITDENGQEKTVTYPGTIKGSVLEIDMETTENYFDLTKGAISATYKNNTTKEEGTFSIGGKEGNDTAHGGKEQDEGLNNFDASNVVPNGDGNGNGNGNGNGDGNGNGNGDGNGDGNGNGNGDGNGNGNGNGDGNGNGNGDGNGNGNGGETGGETKKESIVISVDLNGSSNRPAERYNLSETETILDEDVPLAAVPELGDESSNWLMIAVFAAIGFVALNLSEKKRAED